MSKIELTDVERRDLAARLDTKSLATETMGFKVRGSVLSGGAVVAAIPDSLAGAVVSVCGVKGFMIDERRRFPKPDGTHEDVDCAAVAALEITDSLLFTYMKEHEKCMRSWEEVGGWYWTTKWLLSGKAVSSSFRRVWYTAFCQTAKSR